MANLCSLLDAFRVGRPLAPFFMPVVRTLGSGSDDQEVVLHDRSVREKDCIRVRVYVNDIAEQHSRILLLAQDAAQGRSDFSGR